MIILPIDDCDINRLYFDRNKNNVVVYVDDDFDKPLYVSLSLTKHYGLTKINEEMKSLELFKNMNKIKHNYNFYRLHIQMYKFVYESLFKKKYIFNQKIRLLLYKKTIIYDHTMNKLDDITLKKNQSVHIIIRPHIVFNIETEDLIINWLVIKLIAYPLVKKIENKMEESDGYCADNDMTEYN